MRTVIVHAAHAPRSRTAYDARKSHVTIHQRFAAVPDSMSWRNSEPTPCARFGSAPRHPNGASSSADAASAEADAASAARARAADARFINSSAAAGTTKIACAFVMTASAAAAPHQAAAPRSAATSAAIANAPAHGSR